MRHKRVWAGSIPATLIAGLLFVSTSCAAITARQTSSPEASASAPAATPAESPTPGTSPPTATTVVPSPSSVTAPLARLIITSVTFHAAEVGVAYAPVTLSAIGGRAPYTWTANSGTLPTGLALSSDGKVTGTPSVAGTFSFVVRVDDAAGGAAGVARSVAVARHITASGLCATQVCSVEQGCVTVCGTYGTQTGGVGPFKYAVTSGGLPPSTSLKGLSLAGTFTVPSKFFFTVKVTDSLGATAGVSANFNVFQHIAFAAATATCNGYVISGCTTQFRYLGGVVGGKPTVSVTQNPKYPPLPKGSTFTAAAGVVSVTIPGLGCAVYGNTGFDAVVTLVLVDQSPCGAGYNCSSGKLSLTIHLLVC